MEKHRIDDMAFVAGRWPLDPALQTIVFIHGAGGTSVLWHAQVKALAYRLNTIALDLPGHGDSGGKSMDRVEDYAASVSRFIRSTGALRPVVCGVSMGGAIALQLLIDEQEAFSAGIAANTGAKLKTMPFVFEMIEKDYIGFVNGMYTFAASAKIDPEKIKPLVDGMKKMPPEIAKGDFIACNGFDVMDRLDRIRIPVLVITAAEDQLTPVKYGRFLADKINGAEIVNIEDAGHLSPMEKPEAVTQAIDDFLARL